MDGDPGPRRRCGRRGGAAGRSGCGPLAQGTLPGGHVDDHCRGVQLVAEGGRAGEVYNIGGGTQLSIRQLTGLLLEATGAGWERVRAVPDRLGHDRRYCVDITKISRELGYAPQVPFAEGLAATVEWYRANRGWWEPRLRSERHPA